MFGAAARHATSVTFVSAAFVEAGGAARLGLRMNKPAVAVRNTRRLGKRDMKLNDATPTITVDPETYRVEADGEWLTCEPAQSLPMAQRYFLF
jgi:urease subunit alpha